MNILENIFPAIRHLNFDADRLNESFCTHWKRFPIQLTLAECLVENDDSVENDTFYNLKGKFGNVGKAFL